MKKYLFLIITMAAVISVSAVLGTSIYESYSAGMGYETSEEAIAANQAFWAAGGGAAGMAAVQAVTNAYEGTTGVKGDFDHDGIPDNQQSASQPAAQPAQTTETTQKADTSQKTETTQKTEATETPEEPEEPEHEHSYRKEITTMPTCTEDGVATYTCDECGDSYTESIPATGHDEGEWSTEVEPTCTTAGKEVLKCTRCGEILDEREIPALGHTPGEWEVTKQADWIHDGEQIKKCTVCGEILETEVIPANHVPLYIIGGCVLAVIILIVVIVAVRKRGKTKPKSSKAKS